MRDLANQWSAAKDAHLAVERANWEAFVSLEKISEERKRVTSELARPMQDLRAFIKEATGDAINRRWADFDRWAHDFEREIAR